MNSLQQISDIFSILHDGTIVKWSGDHTSLELIIECEYLAQRIQKNYSVFHLKLFDVDNIEFQTWPNPPDLPVVTFDKLINIFQAELEVLSTEIRDSIVLIYCNQHNTRFHFSGGTLKVSAENIKVFDEGLKEISIEELDRICNDYWQEWSKG